MRTLMQRIEHRCHLILLTALKVLLLIAVLAMPASAAVQDRSVLHTSGSLRSVLAGRSSSLVLDRVTIIDVEHGARLQDQRVVIVGNHIDRIGSRRTVATPAGAQIVDARGKYVIPGLWDMHAHPGTDFFSSDKIWSYPLARAAYLRLIANGVTGIRDAGTLIPLDTLQQWKREFATSQRVGPRMIVSGPSINSPYTGSNCTKADHAGASCTPSEVFHLYIYGPEDATQLVDSLKAAGADMIKIHEVSPQEYFAIAAAARRARIPFGGHIAPGSNALEASDSGALIVDHAVHLSECERDERPAIRQASPSACTAAAAHLRRQHTWIAITGVMVRPLHPDSSFSAFVRRAMRYGGASNYHPTDWQPLSTTERQQQQQLSGAAWKVAVGVDSVTGYPQGCQSAQLWSEANIPLLLGPDMLPGPSVHQQLLGLQLCGVPPLWALQAATLNPALALGAADSMGTVAAGKVADLVLLEGDPLKDLWNVTRVSGVITNGRYFDRAALDRLLMEAAVEWHKFWELKIERDKVKDRSP